MPATIRVAQASHTGVPANACVASRSRWKLQRASGGAWVRTGDRETGEVWGEGSLMRGISTNLSGRMTSRTDVVDTAPSRIARGAHGWPGYAQPMSENPRIARGWIYIDGSRQDDSSIKLGTGGEMRFSPFEAIAQREQAQITWGHILTASVQRLAFWQR
jgi:hypothetical protein